MKNYDNMLEDLDEKSEVYEMLMIEPPKFYLRSGFGLISVFLLLVIVMCYFIDYSNYISSEVKIVSSNPRAPLIINVNGRITNLLKNNSNVKKKDLIAVIENSAKLGDVLWLEKKISNISIKDLINNINFNRELNLGELQNSYSVFQKAKKELEIYYTIQSNKSKTNNLKKELIDGVNLTNSLNEEKKSLDEKLKLSQSQLKRNEILFNKGVISLNDYEIAKQKHIDIVNSYQSKISQIRQNQISNQKTSSTISSTVNEDNETNERVITNAETTLNQLKSDIELWKRKYLIESPIEGILALNGVWANQQVVTVGEELGSVVPKNENVFAIAKMPELESGKVFKNSDVFIYLNSYNYSEYGTIKGVVKNISPVPIEGFYNVNIELPNSLNSDLGYSVPFSPELSGEARLITEKMNLLERLFYKLKKLFSRKKQGPQEKEEKTNDKNIK